MLRLALALSLLPILAQQPAPPPAAAPAPASRPAEVPPVVRKHELALAGRTLNYTTTTGMMPIANSRGELEANIFYMAYTLDGVTDPSRRRLMFSFNGGPGSASVWLHLGAIGPVRVPMNDDGSMPAPPFKLVPNEFTWLTDTDLVFIDPVGTGYSRPVKPELQQKFSSRTGDVESVGEFIRLYLTRNQRWMSPLFVVGESYGTTRAAGLAGYLVDRGVAFNGIALISTVLNFETLDFSPGNDLPYPLILPSFTATAWYHQRLTAELQKRPLRELLKEVEQWALAGYLEALARGDKLAPAERKAAVDKLARYTGLDPKFIDQADLRLDLSSFSRELLREKGLLSGRLDSRLTGPAPRNLSRGVEFDPSMSAIRPPYTAAFYDYVRRELGYSSDEEYHILGGGIGRWDPQANNEFVNVSDSLRRAFTRNPFMKLYLGAGYYDMATPYFSAYYTLDHMGLPPAAKPNIRTHEYEAGHMYYINLKSLEDLSRDMKQFLDWAAPVK